MYLNRFRFLIRCMNFVFFDIECANCLKGEGKICSFGYVKTDENFQVIKKKDIIMNPNAPFLLGNVKTGEGIKLAYPLFKFKNSYTFPHYYLEIKALLEDENNMCLGFAVAQDISYLSYSCQRYNLPIIKCRFFDIQRMEKEINHRKNNSGLDHLVQEFNLTPYTYHRSDDDAMMTMEVFQCLLKTHNISYQDAFSLYRDALNDTDHFLKDQEARKKQKSLKQRYHLKVTYLHGKPLTRFDINLYNPNLYKKVVYFSSNVLEKDIDFLYQHKKEIDARGIILTRNPSQALLIIVNNKNKVGNYEKLREDVIFEDYEWFKKELLKRGN